MVAAWIYARTRAWAATSNTVRQWRERRYRLFLELCGVHPDEPILDVGAGKGGALERFNTANPIVAVDLRPDTSEWLDAPNVDVRVGDGTRLGFADHEFPVVFSISPVRSTRSKPASSAESRASTSRSTLGNSCGSSATRSFERSSAAASS